MEAISRPRRVNVMCLAVGLMLGVGASLQAQGKREAPPTPSAILPPAAEPGPAVPEAAQASLAKLGLTLETLPVIDGSTSTQPLAMLLGATAVGMQVQWPAMLFRDGIRMLQPVPASTSPSALAGSPTSPSLAERVRTRQTHGAYAALIQGEADLILVAREPSEDELTLAAEKGVELDVRPVALDALIFIANQQNPVESLTLEQVRAIYRGEITHWSAVGGHDAEIHGITRPRNSGSQELMDKLVMKGDEITPRMRDRMFLGMGPVIEYTRVEPRTLGYTIYYYQRYMMPEAHPAVPEGILHPAAPGDPAGQQKIDLPAVLANDRAWKELAIDGIQPGPETIADRSYPLTEPVYVVVRQKDAADSAAMRLRDWLLTPEGQQLVAASGYVPYRAVE